MRVVRYTATAGGPPSYGLLEGDPESGDAVVVALEGAPYEEVVANPAVPQMVGGYVDEMNQSLNRWETIKKWRILDHDLTIESGELTPSMKVKRNVVQGNYQDRIDAFYA